MPSELFDRLARLFDESFAATTHAGQNDWARGFGGAIADVHTVMPHQTAGWPSRNKAASFVTRYTTQRYGEDQNGAVVPCANCRPTQTPVAQAGCTCKWGIGPEYYISSDGTVARLIGNQRDQARVTFHGNHTNSWAIGVETGNLFTTGSPPGGGWRRASRTPNVEDITGANLWLRDHRDQPREVIACWWTTANWQTPMREAPAAADTVRMLFTDQQYRSWALLARFLAEQFDVPRNVPVLPHAERPDTVRGAAAAAAFGRIVTADPNFDALVAAFPAAWQLRTAQFTPANAANLRTRYDARAAGGVNSAWTTLIENFRGFHGHGYSGSNSGGHHDCPGPLWDWHRFARELWDYWWFPFDLTVRPPTLATFHTAGPRREYREPTGTTPLLEYFFDTKGSILEPPSQHDDRIVEGIHGPGSSPTTFRLEEDSPVYALANGELVAARFNETTGPNASVSLSFALVRHEVFHLAAGAVPGQPAPAAGRIDYDRPPSVLFSLYMHLAQPDALSLDQVSTDNPDWLNRVIVRFKECSLGIAFRDGDPTATPPVAPSPNIPVAAWNTVAPPGSEARATLLDRWRIDQVALRTFLDQLRAGQVAVAPVVDQGTRISVVLGDFLGNGGVISTAGSTTTHGVRVEVFAPTLTPPTFNSVLSWDFSGTVVRPSVQGASEWARQPTQDERAVFAERGVADATLTTDWWALAAAATARDPRTLPAGSVLPAGGNVVHVRVLDLLEWVNDVTWRSEWPKFRNTGATPGQPRSRRG